MITKGRGAPGGDRKTEKKMRNDDEMEEMIRLTERIDVILNQKQLREDPKLEQSLPVNYLS